MKNKRLISKMLTYFFAAVSFVMFALAIFSYCINSLNTENYLLCFCFAAVLYVFADFWADSVKEDENPLSYKNKKAALNFIYCSGSGAKSSFVDKFSPELYQYFLVVGYIRELNTKSDIFWEITLHGRQKKEEIAQTY